jgi:hypothetical protein|tara:strand:- start:1276 stop:1596 length:321 start_codon:yes stop_codon:yes gene_type:complete
MGFFVSRYTSAYLPDEIESHLRLIETECDKLPDNPSEEEVDNIRQLQERAEDVADSYDVHIDWLGWHYLIAELIGKDAWIAGSYHMPGSASRRNRTRHRAEKKGVE